MNMPARTVVCAAVALAIAGCGGDTEAIRTGGASPAPSSSNSSAPASPPPATRSTPNPTPSADDVTDLEIGDGITATGANDRTSITVVGVAPRKTAVREYGSSPKNDAFYNFLIQYECLEGTCSYNPYDFTLRDSDGVEYDQAYDGAVEPTLDSGELRAGTKAKGTIAFDLGSGVYYLEYRSNFLSDDVAVWKYVATP